MKILKNKESGAVMIIEAVIIFPIIFIVLFLLIYLGNAYFLKARIDSLVTQYAIAGAADCADPMLQSIDGAVPTSPSAAKVKPYRYLFTGYMNEVAGKVTSAISKKVKQSGFFNNMPVKCSCVAKANSKIFGSTFSVEAEYKIHIPVRIFDVKLDLLKFNSRSEVPITDVGEFIRNVDMAVDYIESSQTIQTAMGKVKSFLDKVGGGNK